MSGRITVAGARYFQRLLFGNAVDPYPEYYLALVRQEGPTVFATADELDEVDAPGYGRAAIGNNPGQWTEAITLTRTNVEDVIFNDAQTDWGTIKHWALCTQDEGGDVLLFGTMTAPVDVYALDRVVVPAGTIAFGLNVLYQGD